jgi:hypothetical protein
MLPDGGDPVTLTAQRIAVGDALEDFQELAESRGWGDGLPLVPPTPDRVEAMLGNHAGNADVVLGDVPPSWHGATLEVVAINAVMAGCSPAHFPIVCATVAAVTDPLFNLYGMQATTNPVAPLIVVNGPVRGELGFNGGANAFGIGSRANATVGRALRLVLNNVGDAKPDGHDRATHGFPGKFTFCVAENEEASPWEPLHVARGFDVHASTVTVMGIQAFHNMVEFVSTEATDVLDAVAVNMAVPGLNNISYGGEPAFAFCPEHARIVAGGGFGRADVQRYVFERARCDLRDVPAAVQEMLRSRRPAWCDLAAWPVCDSPEDIIVFVVGGAGTHGVFLPSFGATTAVTRRIDSVMPA